MKTARNARQTSAPNKSHYALSNRASLQSIMNQHLVHLPKNVFKTMPGQKNLLNTFEFRHQTTPTDFFTQKGAFSWNTFTQQLLIDHPKSLDENQLVRDYKKIGEAVYSSLYLTHEALHILLWEPFFNGNFKLKNLKQYTDFALCFEGLAFWYTDIWLTPKVKAKFPDGSFTFTKSTVSSPFFHPDRALEVLKVKDRHKALDVYMDGFTGYDTKDMLKSKNGYVQNLAQRIFEFFASTLKLTVDHFSIMERTGIFDEYWKRFCKLKNIPTLMDENFSLSLNDETVPYRYTKKVFYDILPKIDKLSSKKIHSVFQRRGIQTRAYMLYAMKDLFTEDRIIRPNLSKVNTTQYIRLINEAIDRLEVIMKDLCQSSANPNQASLIDHKIQLFDEYYETVLRSKFRKEALFVRNFHQLLPKSQNVGMINAGECKDHKALLQRFLSTYASLGKNPEHFLKYSKKDWSIQNTLASQLAAHKDKKMSKKQIEKWVSLYNQWMSSPNLIWRWSKPLDIQSFKEGYLMELGYSYE